MIILISIVIFKTMATTYQSTKSGAGGPSLLPGCRARASAKGIYIYIYIHLYIYIYIYVYTYIYIVRERDVCVHYVFSDTGNVIV